jgi:hypothetical protein
VTPTLTTVRSWNPQALADIAAGLVAVDDEFVAEIDRAPRWIESAHHDWSGASYDAAYDRVRAERDAAAKVSQEVRELARTFGDAADRMFWARDLVLTKVDAAVRDGCVISDDWYIGAGAGSTCSDELVEEHRWAVGAAVDALVREDEEIARLIADAAIQVRTRGDQVGDGAGTSKAEEEGAGRLGREDGEALAAAAASGDTAALDRIADQLPTQALTPSELADLAVGREVSTVPQSVQDYYGALYRSAGREGVLALGDHLKAQETIGNAAAGRQLNAVANGIMLVSNENIGSGRNQDGSLRSPGSYNALPQDLRDLISTRPTGPDANADWYPGGTGTIEDQFTFFRDTERLGALLTESEPGFVPGAELSRELTRQAASLATPGDVPGATAHPGATMSLDRVEPMMRDYLEVSGRNHEAMAQLLTGEGSPALPLDEDYKPANTVVPLLTHDWSDDAGDPELFGWIGENAVPTADVSTAEAEQAGRAATGLISVITAGGVDGETGTFETLMNLPDHNDNALGEINPGLTRQIANAVTPYLGDIAIGPELQTFGFDRQEALGDNEDVGTIRLATLMNTDDISSAAFNGAIIDQTNHYAERFGELHGEDSNIRHQLGAASGRLLGIMDQGLRAEAYDGGLDDTAAEEKRVERSKLAIDVATKIVVGVGGPYATPVDVASSVWQSTFEPDYKPLPDEAFRSDSSSLAAQRAHSMVAGLLESHPDLVETGGLPDRWFENGNLRTYQDIVGRTDTMRQDLDLQSTVEELLYRADLLAVRYTDPLDAAKGDLAGYTTDADHYRSKILGENK